MPKQQITEMTLEWTYSVIPNMSARITHHIQTREIINRMGKLRIRL